MTLIGKVNETFSDTHSTDRLRFHSRRPPPASLHASARGNMLFKLENSVLLAMVTSTKKRPDEDWAESPYRFGTGKLPLPRLVDSGFTPHRQSSVYQKDRRSVDQRLTVLYPLSYGALH
jgi:hypothetical protein